MRAWILALLGFLYLVGLSIPASAQVPDPPVKPRGVRPYICTGSCPPNPVIITFTPTSPTTDTAPTRSEEISICASPLASDSAKFNGTLISGLTISSGCATKTATYTRVERLATVISKALPGFSGGESTPILLVVGTDSMIVSVAAVQRWWADYSFGSQEVGQSFDKAGRAEAKHGVEYVWHLHTQPLKGAVGAAKRS